MDPGSETVNRQNYLIERRYFGLYTRLRQKLVQSSKEHKKEYIYGGYNLRIRLYIYLDYGSYPLFF